MELKEAILSTLAEMQEDAPSSVIKAEEIGEIDEAPNENRHIEPPQLHNLSSVELDANEVLESMIKKEPPLMPMAQESMNLGEQHTPMRTQEARSDENIDSDRRFLEGLRERILVMFEGMQSPNNRAAEAKIDLILNFFEWQLSLIDERLESKK